MAGPVQLDFGSGPEPFEGIDASGSGLAVTGPVGAPVGSFVRVRFVVDRDPVELAASIVRCRRTGSAYVVGLRFAVGAAPVLERRVEHQQRAIAWMSQARPYLERLQSLRATLRIPWSAAAWALQLTELHESAPELDVAAPPVPDAFAERQHVAAVPPSTPTPPPSDAAATPTTFTAPPPPPPPRMSGAGRGPTTQVSTDPPLPANPRAPSQHVRPEARTTRLPKLPPRAPKRAIPLLSSEEEPTKIFDLQALPSPPRTKTRAYRAAANTAGPRTPEEHRRSQELRELYVAALAELDRPLRGRRR